LKKVLGDSRGPPSKAATQEWLESTTEQALLILLFSAGVLIPASNVFGHPNTL